MGTCAITPKYRNYSPTECRRTKKHHDADLAKQIYALFSSDFPGSPWKTSPVEHRQWLDNPSSKSRIVIFADHSHADGVKAAINDCELLPKKVARHPRMDGMAADITIVIFDKVGKENW